MFSQKQNPWPRWLHWPVRIQGKSNFDLRNSSREHTKKEWIPKPTSRGWHNCETQTGTQTVPERKITHVKNTEHHINEMNLVIHNAMKLNLYLHQKLF